MFCALVTPLRLMVASAVPLPLVPVTVTAEPNSVTLPGIAPVTAPSGSIHIELPGRAVISVEAGVDPELVRTVLGSLLR